MNDWNGKGLPPIGAECVFYCDTDEWCWTRKLNNGHKVKIVAHEKTPSMRDVAVFVFTSDCGVLPDDLCSEMAVAECFQPLQPVDPRRAVLEDLFEYAERFNRARVVGCDLDKVMIDTRARLISEALRELDNLPPF